MTLTHLHVHSHFSLLEATTSLEALVGRAAAEGMTHLALTDSFALYGAVAFRRLCREAGIHPITGMTVSVADPLLPRPALLVLLATGPEGYRSLCHLSSHVQGHADREERLRRGLTWEMLAAHREGLIALDGGLAGWAARFLQQDAAAAAGAYLDRFASVFPDGYVSLELQRPGDDMLAARLAALGRARGLEAVAVQPVYQLAPGETEQRRLLQAIDRNCLLEEVSLPPERCWLSPAEMARRFAAFPEALARTGEIATRCGPALPEGSSIWPALDLPRPAAEELARQAEEGLRTRYPAGGEDAAARLQQELAAINRHGFAPLFLVVADIVRFAKEAGIPVSTRGSVANCLVAYCLGITGVDPLAHDLLFERFLNPARASLPDIDLDFCSRRRAEVLAYVRRTYGEDRVALVATVTTLQPRSAVRETAKAFGYDEASMKRLARLLPHGWHPDPRRRSGRTLDDVLAEVTDARDRATLAAAFALVGQPHHLSVHPGGLVIAPGPLASVVPVQIAPKGFLITQYDHHDVEAIGLPKLDLLGIRALTVLADATARIQADDPTFSLEGIPEADEVTARLLAAGETVGVFQCESEGARRTLRQLQARSVADLAVANAFFKPGPATGGMAAAFIRRYRGDEAVSYLHPALEPILAPTKGVLLFQEQILRLAREIAGLSWAQADHLRRGMTQFAPAEMEAIAAEFRDGCRAGGLSGRQAATLWEQVAAFAGYGFNQGHATAYAAVSYRSAYLKAHYPAVFLWARLLNAGGFFHPAVYLAEAVRLGCRVRPPHVNASSRRVTLTKEGGVPTVWLGLGRVRDLRRTAIRAILRERPFSSVRDLAARVPLQEKELRHLIQCGALDGLGASRAAMLAEAAEMARAGSTLQMAFAFGAPDVPAETPAERLAWEQRLLGQPVSVHPLALLPPMEGLTPLHALPQTAGKRVSVRGVRLPGWTGAPGFYLADEETFVRARSDGPAPTAWQPLQLTGRWRTDAWGGGWLEVEASREAGA
ncbi:MAG: DNA polymerase III subunit alpha [Chloroflexi bacterium]|nr:DNA polymerase III subunit alpha [Chloroflexota bacterium]